MGKRAPSRWNKHVKATFEKMKALDGGAKFKDALKEAAKTYTNQSGGMKGVGPAPAPADVEGGMGETVDNESNPAEGQADNAAPVGQQGGKRRRRRRTQKKSRKAGGKKSRKSKKTKKRSRKSKKH